MNNENLIPASHKLTVEEQAMQTGLRNDTFRTQVDDFDKSQAQKAVWANKKIQKNIHSIQVSDKISKKKFKI